MKELEASARALVIGVERIQRAVRMTGTVKRLLEAADACDREAERHPSSRSSAPMVRYIKVMEELRAESAAFEALEGIRDA